MIIYHENNLLHMKDIIGNETVEDLLNALDLCLKQNPLPCSSCKDNCCKRHWDIGIDNVYFLRKTNNKPHNIDKFIKREFFVTRQTENTLPFISLKPINKSCKDLSGTDRCLVYNQRPLVCRTFTCINKEKHLDLLTQLIFEVGRIGFTYNILGVINKTDVFMDDYKNNPFYEKYDYNISIKDILLCSRKSNVFIYEDEKTQYEDLFKIFNLD